MWFKKINIALVVIFGAEFRNDNLNVRRMLPLVLGFKSIVLCLHSSRKKTFAFVFTTIMLYDNLSLLSPSPTLMLYI
jgi:hypothetical protein